MIKWFLYIVLLLLLIPNWLLAKKNGGNGVFFNEYRLRLPLHNNALTDTASKNAKHQQEQERKVKEVGKARRQSKPEKIGATDLPATPKEKPKRQRRPEGLERPPEIPRRNGG